MSTPAPPAGNVPPYAWLPTTDEVAAFLRARTKDENGAELGIWTADTRPTDAEVVSIIDVCAGFVGSAVDEIGALCEGSAKQACALRAALVIELSYFPEQVRSDRSPYEELKDLFNEAMSSLGACVSGSGGGGPDGEGYGYHSQKVRPETTAMSGQTGWRHPEDPSTWAMPLVVPSDADPAPIDEPDVLDPRPADWSTRPDVP